MSGFFHCRDDAYMHYRARACSLHTFVLDDNDSYMDDIQYKTAGGRLEIKSDSEGKLHIRGYACAFGNVDSYGDIIDGKACDAWLASEDAARVALCYQHDMGDVIGVITDKGVDEYGLWFEADILPTASGRDVQVLIKGDAIREFSIGYYAIDYHWEMRDGRDVRVLDNIRIVEISPVTRAANPKAVLTDMKSEGGMLSRMTYDELMEMRGSIDNEIAARIIARL